MKKYLKTLSSFFLVVFLSSCSSGTKVNDKASEEYVSTLSNFYDGYRVLQLTDIHWNFYTDIPKEEKYLTKVVEEANPDLIIITGDCVLEANKSIVSALFSTIDSWNIPYTFSWGNHDRQGIYSPSWISSLASSGKNSLYHEVDDDVTGLCNKVVNLKKDDGKVYWQVYTIDSNTYINDSALSYGYDYIHDDQVDWFKAQSEAAKTNNSSAYVPSLFYFHIPLYEWVYSYWDNNESSSGIVLGEINQESTNSVKGLTDSTHPTIPFWPADSHSGIFDAAKSRNVKGMFCGHDHFNDWVTSYQGITIGYGLKTGRGLEYTKNKAGVEMTGGALSILHEDGSFDLEHIFVNCDDYKVNITKKEGIV
jgi:3',5'-cyclic AMP phosphodiesterase CpdA